MTNIKKAIDALWVIMSIAFPLLGDETPCVEMRLSSQKQYVSEGNVPCLMWNIRWNADGMHALSNYLFCIGHDVGSDMICFDLPTLVDKGLTFCVLGAMPLYYPCTLRFSVGDMRWVTHTQLGNNDHAFWGAYQTIRVELSDATSLRISPQETDTGGAESHVELNFGKKETQKISKLLIYSNKPLPAESRKIMRMDQTRNYSVSGPPKDQSVPLKSGYIWAKLIAKDDPYVLHLERFKLNEGSCQPQPSP